MAVNKSVGDAEADPGHSPKTSRFWCPRDPRLRRGPGAPSQEPKAPQLPPQEKQQLGHDWERERKLKALREVEATWEHERSQENKCPTVPGHRGPVTIGRGDRTWRWTEEEGFDLTDPRPGEDLGGDDEGGDGCGRGRQELHLRLTTWNSPIKIAAAKTAMVIIDMQNLSLCKALSDRPEPHEAMRALLNTGIPAARRAGIQIIWLNWGLTPKDLEELPPSVDRVFRFGIRGDFLEGQGIDYDLGEVPLEEDEIAGFAPAQTTAASVSSCSTLADTTVCCTTGCCVGKAGKTTVKAGRFLVRGEWNTQLYAPLLKEYQESQRTQTPSASTPSQASAFTGPRGLQENHEQQKCQGRSTPSPPQLPDVLFHKSRISGLCDESLRANGYDLLDFLKSRDLRTLLFAGINVDFCVMATLQDANMRGFDTVLLEDAAQTVNGDIARKAAYDACRRGWGFRSSCSHLEFAVDAALADVSGG